MNEAGFIQVNLGNDMNIEALKELISKGESDTLEFKTSTAKIKSAFQTLSAFLNEKGGMVIIGVKDDGRIVGQEVTDQTNLEISNLVTKLEPPVSIGVEYIGLDNNKFVIKLTAALDDYSHPCIFDGKPYWRINSSTKPMPQQRYQQLLLNHAHAIKPWDSEISSAISVGQLE